MYKSRMGVKHNISTQIHCCLNFLLPSGKRTFHKLKEKYIISVISAQTGSSSGLTHLCAIIFKEHMSKFMLKYHNLYCNLEIAYNKYHLLLPL